MTNFKVGQKVVYVGTDPYYPKREWHVIKAIRKAPCCGSIWIDCGYTPNYIYVKCTKCNSVHISNEYVKRSEVFRPLSYSSNVNMEVISLFQPTEERQDLKPQPKKIEA